jgi:MFS family permease
VLGASFTMVGVIEGIAESTASLLKVFSGWLSDRWKKRKNLTVLGYTLSMIAKPLLAFAQVPWHVLFVRFSDRFGKGLRQAPRDALIAESTQPAHLGYAYGFHKAMDTLGATAGPLIAILLLPILNNNYRSLFLFSFVASFFAVLTLVAFVKEPRHTDASAHLPKLSLRILPRSYKFFLAALAIFALGNFSDAFLFLRSQNVGISPMLIPILYALSNIFFAGFAAPFGKLADRIGPYKIMMVGYFVFALTHAGFALFASARTVWLLFPMFGIFSAMTESIQKTITVKISDENLKGTMLGLMHTIIGIFQLPASIIAGLLWDKIDPRAPFFFGSSLAILALLFLLFSFFLTKNQKTILQETH